MIRSIVLALVVVFCTNSAHAVSIPTVPITNPGNPADFRYDPAGVGSLSYTYRIGKYEITNSQYAEFLNAVGASDPYLLYNSATASDTRGGINRSGSPGSYTYSVKLPAVGRGPGGTDYAYGNKPAVFISWLDAIRFTNWLHNGQGNGDTETGAYTLLAGPSFPIPSNVDSITRNPGARWWIPSEDEWYKAAYYDPTAGIYYDYPTGTNSTTNNSRPSADTGNSANFFANSIWTTGNYDYPITDIGAYTLSTSPNKTYDQGGNAAEWTEKIRLGYGFVHRGGWWDGDLGSLSAEIPGIGVSPLGGGIGVGFRVATTIPEPGPLTLAAFGLLAVLLRRRRLTTP